MDPVNIELKLDTKPHADRLHNIPKVYEKMAKTEVNCLCTVYVVLEKLSHTQDRP